MLKNWVKLTLSMILNQGIRGSSLSDLAVQVEERDGVLLLGTGAVLTIQAKRDEDLTPRERLRKRLIISFLVSIIFMIVLGAVGALVPDANLGRWLILLSEVPAFISALVSTRIFMRKPKMKLMTPEQLEQERIKPPIIIPPSSGSK